MSIGQELLDVPFPDMIYKMANAIAQGQRRLDKTSLDTARSLARLKVSVIPEIYEIVETKKISDALNPGTTLPGSAGDASTISVRSESAKPVAMSLMQAGLMPTFYQFTESLIEVKISISHRSSFSSEFEVGTEFEFSSEVEAEAHASASFFGLFGGGGSVKTTTSTTFASHVNYKSSATYSYTAEGSSLLRTTLKPVPPPSRIVPRIVTVDATDPDHVKVTFGA